MGDIAEKLKEAGLGEDFAQAAGYAEAVYSKVNMAYGAYSTGKDVLIYLGVLGKPDDPLEQLNKQLAAIQRTLDEILSKLEENKRATVDASKLVTRTQILNEVSDACIAAYNARAFLEHPDDPQIEADFDHARILSQQAADHLYRNEYYWKRIYLVDSLYSDAWSGILYPEGVTEAGTADGYIWDYRLPLIAYLESLANRSIVLLASSPDVRQAHRPQMLAYADQLCEHYRRILGQFKAIRPPTSQEMTYVIPAMDDARFYKLDLDGSTHLPLTSSEREGLLDRWIPGGRWRRAGYLLGAVDQFAGYVCKAGYPQEELRQGAAHLAVKGSFWVSGAQGAGMTVTIAQPQAYQAFYERFILRHTLRSRRQAAQLFTELGLPGVLSCIRDLYATLGLSPPQGLPDPTIWSMREVCSWLPAHRQNEAMDGPCISLRKLGTALETQAPVSLRRMLLLEETTIQA